MPAIRHLPYREFLLKLSSLHYKRTRGDMTLVYHGHFDINLSSFLLYLMSLIPDIIIINYINITFSANQDPASQIT